jgi:hydrogenase-4 component B
VSPILLLLLAMVTGHVGGAAGALVVRSARGVRGLTAAGAILGSAAGLALALDALVRGTELQLDIPQLLGIAGGVGLRLDRLGAFFLLVVEVVAVPAALFGGSYARAYDDAPGARLVGVMLNLFLLTLGLVPLADNVLTFLLLWEAMSVTSYFLVLTESDRREARQAGLWYLAMAHGGLVLVMAALLLVAAGAPSTGFADLRATAATLPGSTRNAVFVLALLGFGSKAGLVPLHVWLPLAHPAAPSHVSALMSGVMIKMGVYGILRVTLDLLGGGPPWWGGVILAAGGVSALLGVLYALMEHDIKRLLAYHSVENIGIICLGIGAGLMFGSYGLTPLALVGLVAGLYHTLNHACFKGLLFLGAGAVVHATHTRNMEELGGLVKSMPRTALCFLVGAAAISGLPPLNGFVSEWLVFQALLGGPRLPHPELGLIMAFAVGMLALTSGLAAACFVKAFGITFLAIPRSEHAARAHEVPLPMQLAMGALAVACGVLGVGCTLVVPGLQGVVAGLGDMPATLPGTMPRLTLEVPGTVGVIAPAALAAGLGLVPGVLLVAFRLGAADRRRRVGETWGCGRVGQTPRMEYTATAFAEPLRRVFAELYRPTEDLSIDFHPESRYFVQSIAYRSGVQPWLERLLYPPVVAVLRRTALRVRWLQAGSLHLYLLYLSLALVGLLLMSRWIS